MSTKVMSHKPSSARRTMNNKDTGLNTPISSRNALENMSLNRNGKSGSPSTLALPRFDIGKMSPPNVTRFGRSRPDSQFRGIAEVVKEFMEYIAESPLHEDRD